MNNRFLEKYLIYFNIWLMQWENVQYLANSENYWYRFESEKPGLWVKMTWGQNQIDLNLIHLLITKSSLILVSDSSWRNSIIDNIWNFPKFRIIAKIASIAKMASIAKNACFLCSTRLASFFHELFLTEKNDGKLRRLRD